MASGDRIDFVRPKDLIPTNGVFNELPLVLSGVQGGCPLGKLDTQGYVFESRVPTNGTPLSTGLTFQIGLVDDPANSSPGLVARLGIIVKKLATTADDLTLTSAGTEQFFTATMNATTGIITLVAAAVANANLDSLVAGDRFLVQVRRNGGNAADTHQGRVLITGITVSDT